MKFWDTSSVVPLLVEEEEAVRMKEILSKDRSVIWWWGTPIECASTLWRKVREGTLTATELDQASNRLSQIRKTVDQIEPGHSLQELAIRLVAIHPLRAADALQLAAALKWAEDNPMGFSFVSLDRRLREAALREGFTLLPP